jgi:hypothetical protein
MSHKVRRVAHQCITRSLVKTVFQSDCRLANTAFMLDLNSIAQPDSTTDDTRFVVPTFSWDDNVLPI